LANEAFDGDVLIEEKAEQAASLVVWVLGTVSMAGSIDPFLNPDGLLAMGVIASELVRSFSIWGASCPSAFGRETAAERSASLRQDLKKKLHSCRLSRTLRDMTHPRTRKSAPAPRR